MLHYGWRSSFLLSAILAWPPARFGIWRRETIRRVILRCRPRNCRRFRAVFPNRRRQTHRGWRGSTFSPAAMSGFSRLPTFLRLCGLDFLQLVLFVSRESARAGPEIERAVCNLPFLAMAVCSPLGGMVSDALSRHFGSRLGRCSVAALGFGLTAIFLVFGSAAHDSRLASVVLAGGAGSLYLSQSAFWAVSADLGGSQLVDFRLHEYGEPDWGRTHGDCYALVRRYVWAGARAFASRPRWPSLAPWLGYSWTLALTLHLRRLHPLRRTHFWNRRITA